MRRSATPADHIRPRADARKGDVPMFLLFLRRSRRIVSRRLGANDPALLHVRQGLLRNRRVAVVNPGLGAPAAVMALEHAVRDGYREFWFLGACGALDRELRIGDIVLVEAARSDEGTSRLYTRTGPNHSPDRIFTEALGETARRRRVEVRRGGVWSTDAPYRESAARIRRYRSGGYLGIDMEVSALLAVARVRKVRIAGLLVVSDTLGEVWTIGWHWKAFRRGEDLAREILLETALRGSQTSGERAPHKRFVDGR